MSDSNWNPWKMTTIGMVLVLVTALVTGLVVANWPGNGNGKVQTTSAVRRAPVRYAAAPAEPVRYAAPPASCDRTPEVLKDALIGGAVGAGVGAASGAIVGGKHNPVGKGAAIGGLVGATAGTAYGLNQPCP